MQYIQLQPQIGTNVPTPSNGNVNYYFDIDDKLIKTKDSNGIFHGVTHFVSVTKSQMDVMITNSTLLVGQFYMITDANTALYGGTQIILQAVATNKLSRGGTGLFYNPKYVDPNNVVSGRYMVWSNQSLTYIYNTNGFFQINEPLIGDNGQTGNLIGLPGSSTLSFIETGGDWSTSNHIYGQNSEASTLTDGFIHRASYNVGDKVIWGGKVWINLTGVIGSFYSASELDSTNWQVVPYNTTDYDLVVDIIEYEYEYDNISYRKDANNEVFANYDVLNNSWGRNNIAYFPWGNKTVENVKINNAFIDNLVNFPNQTYVSANLIQFVNVEEYAELDASNWGWGTQMRFINIGRDSGIYNVVFGNKVRIYGLTLGIDSYCGGLNFSNNDTNTNQLQYINIGDSSEVENIKIFDNSYMQGITIGANSYVENITLYGYSYFNDIRVEDNCYISNCSLSPSSFFNKVTLDTNSRIQNIQFNQNTGFQRIALCVDSYISNITSNATNSFIYNINLGVSSFINVVDFFSNNISLNSLDLGGGVSLQNISLYDSATYSNHTYLNSANVDGITINASSTLSFIQMDVYSKLNSIFLNNGINISNIEVGLDTTLSGITFDTNTSNKIINLNTSTFEKNIDVTGLNAVDLSVYNYVGLFNLTSSNATEMITSFTNTSIYNQNFTAMSGLTITFSGTSINSIVSNGVLVLPTTTFVVNGSNYDYIKFKPDTNNTYTFLKQVDGKNYI